MRYFVAILLTIILNAQDIYATFRIYGFKEANLAFSSSGIVKKVNVDIGSFVHKGDILAILENNDLKATMQKAKAALDFAKKNFERIKKSKSVLDKQSFDKALFNLQTAKAKFMLAKANYEKTFLKAPFDGVIFYKSIEVGDAVPGSMNPRVVFKIQSKTKRKLILHFNQEYLGKVKVGMPFKFTIEGMDKNYTAPLSKIYPHLNANAEVTAEVITSNIPSGAVGHGYIKAK